MIDDEINAARLERIEHQFIEACQIDVWIAGYMQVVIVEGGPEQVDLLGQVKRAERRQIKHDVVSTGLGKHLLRDRDVFIAPGRGLERVDLAAGTYHIAQQPRVVAAARKVLADGLPGPDGCVGEHLRRFAIGIALAIGLGARRIRHSLGDVIRYLGVCPSRQRLRDQREQQRGCGDCEGIVIHQFLPIEGTIPHPSVPKHPTPQRCDTTRSAAAAQRNKCRSRSPRHASVRPTGAAPWSWIGIDIAQPSRKFTTAGLRSTRLLILKYASSVSSLAMRGGITGTVGIRNASKPAMRRSTPAMNTWRAAIRSR